MCNVQAAKRHDTALSHRQSAVQLNNCSLHELRETLSLSFSLKIFSCEHIQKVTLIQLPDCSALLLSF